MFSWFEQRINPYPKNDAVLPPKGLFAFCWHYSRHASPWLLMGTLLVAGIAIGEVLLYSFMGDIVDYLTASNPDTFFEENASVLWMMGLVVLIGLPIISTLHALVTNKIISDSACS